MSKDPALAPDVMTQVNLTVKLTLIVLHLLFYQVYPTQTVYVFEEAGIRLTLTVSDYIISSLCVSSFVSVHHTSIYNIKIYSNISHYIFNI